MSKRYKLAAVAGAAVLLVVVLLSGQAFAQTSTPTPSGMAEEVKQDRAHGQHDERRECEGETPERALALAVLDMNQLDQGPAGCSIPTISSSACGSRVNVSCPMTSTTITLPGDAWNTRRSGG